MGETGKYVNEIKQQQEEWNSLGTDEQQKQKDTKEQIEAGETDSSEAIREYLTQHNENKKNPAYLVRGAELICNQGTNKRMMNLSKCHGVYIKAHAVVHELDCVCKDEENITWFGVCNPGEGLETEEIELTADNGEKCHGKKCEPHIIGTWLESFEGTRIVDNGDKKEKSGEEPEGCNTITMDSFLVCKYGGIIMPISSGQDREVEESEFVKGKEAYDRVVNFTCEEEIDREEGCEDLLHAMIADEFKENDISCHGSVYYVSPEERALVVIENWQNDHSLSTHDVYESIKILEDTMTSGEILSHISVRERLWIDMIEHGYSEIAAAGILGNIGWESGGYNVGQLQIGGSGIGLCQWTGETRQQGLYDMADKMELSWDTYEVQVAYIFEEIDNNDYYKHVRPDELNKATSINEATEIFMKWYEAPGDPHQEDRETEAERVYADYATGQQ